MKLRPMQDCIIADEGTTMRKLILAACCIGLLSACKCSVDTKPQVESIPTNTVEKISEAPDGTILWKSKVWQASGWYEDIYFSSSGTQRTVPSGKSTRVVTVPNTVR